MRVCGGACRPSPRWRARRSAVDDGVPHRVRRSLPATAALRARSPAARTARVARLLVFQAAVCPRPFAGPQRRAELSASGTFRLSDGLAAAVQRRHAARLARLRRAGARERGRMHTTPRARAPRRTRRLLSRRLCGHRVRCTPSTERRTPSRVRAAVRVAAAARPRCGRVSRPCLRQRARLVDPSGTQRAGRGSAAFAWFPCHRARRT